jgi:uncharacterized protein YecT (DUF1311 family)
MSKRDAVGEVLEVKSREGRGHEALPGSYPFDELNRLWTKDKEHLRRVTDFFPMRIVTLIEVFTRRWLEKLIDHGTPYLENAAALMQSGGKYDFAVAMAIQGERVSLGQLVAHSVSLNNLDQVAGCFTAVLGEDLFSAIEQTHDRFAVERQGAPKAPIIRNLAETRKNLARLFTVRHIVTHESPSAPPHSEAEIDAFLHAAREFARATEQTIYNRLDPSYPLTTFEMVDNATRANGAANAELASVLTKVEALLHNDRCRELLGRSQVAWCEYRNIQADLRAGHLEGGSYQPLARIRESTRLTVARVEELKWWLTRDEHEI